MCVHVYVYIYTFIYIYAQLCNIYIYIIHIHNCTRYLYVWYRNVDVKAPRIQSLGGHLESLRIPRATSAAPNTVEV